MAKTGRIWVLTLLAVAMLLSIAPSAFANEADIRISLHSSTAFPQAKSTAKYRDRGGVREFEVQVENIKALAGSTVNVFVNGTKVGSSKVSALGLARLSRSTERGQTVPVIRSGSLVQVRTAGGTLIVSGRFP